MNFRTSIFYNDCYKLDVNVLDALFVITLCIYPSVHWYIEMKSTISTWDEFIKLKLELFQSYLFLV